MSLSSDQQTSKTHILVEKIIEKSVFDAKASASGERGLTFAPSQELPPQPAYIRKKILGW